MNEAVTILNRHFTNLNFVVGVSWVDLDDDKIPHCSPRFKEYGMRMTPTKDKKLKPVFHLAATVGSGSGMICWLHPDTLNLKMSDLLRSTIRHLLPLHQPGMRALHAFFINRGYTELARQQMMHVTNLIQICGEENVKFHSIIKDNSSFPFEAVDRNESGKTVNKKRLVV